SCCWLIRSWSEVLDVGAAGDRGYEKPDPGHQLEHLLEKVARHARDVAELALEELGEDGQRHARREHPSPGLGDRDPAFAPEEANPDEREDSDRGGPAQDQAGAEHAPRRRHVRLADEPGRRAPRGRRRGSHTETQLDSTDAQGTSRRPFRGPLASPWYIPDIVVVWRGSWR